MPLKAPHALLLTGFIPVSQIVGGAFDADALVHWHSMPPAVPVVVAVPASAVRILTAVDGAHCWAATMLSRRSLLVSEVPAPESLVVLGAQAFCFSDGRAVLNSAYID